MQKRALRRNRVADYSKKEMRAKERNRIAEHFNKEEKIEGANKDISKVKFFNREIIKCN